MSKYQEAISNPMVQEILLELSSRKRPFGDKGMVELAYYKAIEDAAKESENCGAIWVAKRIRALLKVKL